MFFLFLLALLAAAVIYLNYELNEVFRESHPGLGDKIILGTCFFVIFTILCLMTRNIF